MGRRPAAVLEPQADLHARCVDRGAAADELDIANGRADREARAKEKAQAALRDTAADVARLAAGALPQLAALHDGFDEPMPEDARVAKTGRIFGTWQDVTGDRGEDYGVVEAVDFGALYALISERLPELAGAAA